MKPDGSDLRRFTNPSEFVDAISWFPKGANLISVSVAESRYFYRTYIMDLKGVVQKQLPGFIFSNTPLWAPDGEHFLSMEIVPKDCPGLTVIKADLSDPLCLKIDSLSPPVHNGAASWSPDGKYILFSSDLNGNDDLFRVKKDGSELTRLTNLPGDELAAVWWAAP
jgi:TolB protein